MGAILIMVIVEFTLFPYNIVLDEGDIALLKTYVSPPPLPLPVPCP